MALLIQSEEVVSREGDQQRNAEVSVYDEPPTARDQTGSLLPAIERVYRHRLPVRISHWLNIPFLIILIMSGLQIFNAHPALYWGDRSDREQPLLSIRPVQTESGETKGVTTILSQQFETTGVLGYSDGMGRAFPAWATIPSAKWLAMGRQWHLFFAWLFVINGLIFTAYALASRHATRDLAPTGKDLRGIGKSVKDHLILRHPIGDEAKRYSVLQKLAYTGILFIVAPLIVLTGLAMSPTIDAADDRCRCTFVADYLRRPSGSKDDSLCRLFFARWICRHSPSPSDSHRVLEQHSFDGDRLVCRQT